MFNLNKSWAKLKDFLVQNDLSAEKSSENSESNVKRRRTKKKQEETDSKFELKRGVMMIKNFPHGFYEQQMFDYFSQFGEVTRLKILRSRKTGQPKNIGFVEFRFHDVAKIVAETTNNYLMFDHILKCRVLPEETIRSDLFKNWSRPFVSSIEQHKRYHNRTKNQEQNDRIQKKLQKRINRMNKLLNGYGIEKFKCTVAHFQEPGKSKANNDDDKQVVSNGAEPKGSANNGQVELPIEVILPPIKRNRSTKNAGNAISESKRKHRGVAILPPRFMKLQAGMRRRKMI